MRTKKVKRKIKSFYIALLAVGLILLDIKLITITNNYEKDAEKKVTEKKEVKELQEVINEVKENYNEFAIANKNATLYSKEGKKIGTITKGVNLELEALPENNKSELLKLKYSNLYINYKDIEKSQQVSENKRYKNYIPFNESISANQTVNLHVDEEKYYTLDLKEELPIIIKEDDKYYVEYDNKLLYINKNDNIKISQNQNNSADIAKAVAVLNYHFVIDESQEASKCSPRSICHPEKQFDEHMKYIKENNIFTITMKELEMFHDSKINLPAKSVAITIDDGWFVSRTITIINKYETMATLFLIGSLASPSDYSSPYLEIHSHTWNLHNVSTCSEGRSPLLCYDKNKIVEDLKQSRESLNGTTYFCYPFYEYNDNAISALKEAGFTMALTGGERKATKNDDKFKIPRYVISNETTVNDLKKIID